ncbi:hypothetical protein GWK47_045046 [Chionoecetes opilio]|uniref:Uncharacterized protein n=1 Tax=Chionoecetes opilio TaxID=41210 RepID=A0A8J4Y7Q1_CHIOP|nr:hypothetical protein GWK47_045046 [Chionoecetes opilio]
MRELRCKVTCANSPTPLTLQDPIFEVRRQCNYPRQEQHWLRLLQMKITCTSVGTSPHVHRRSYSGRRPRPHLLFISASGGDQTHVPVSHLPNTWGLPGALPFNDEPQQDSLITCRGGHTAEPTETRPSGDSNLTVGVCSPGLPLLSIIFVARFCLGVYGFAAISFILFAVVPHGQGDQRVPARGFIVNGRHQEALQVFGKNGSLARVDLHLRAEMKKLVEEQDARPEYSPRTLLYGTVPCILGRPLSSSDNAPCWQGREPSAAETEARFLPDTVAHLEARKSSGWVCGREAGRPPQVTPPRHPPPRMLSFSQRKWSSYENIPRESSSSSSNTADQQALVDTLKSLVTTKQKFGHRLKWKMYILTTEAIFIDTFFDTRDQFPKTVASSVSITIGKRSLLSNQKAPH